MLSFLRILALAIVAAVHGTGPASADSVTQLQSTINDVAARWPSVRHIAADDLDVMMRERSVTIFDVRSPEEYAVSHLEGAIRVDSGITRDAFLSQTATALKGKTAVFYCSVGVRSSKLAERVGDAALKSAGATGGANLAGGIFAWHGDARPLFDARGPTDLIHGYNASWGRLVKRQELISSAARK